MRTHVLAALTMAALLAGCAGADDTAAPPPSDEGGAPTDAHDEDEQVEGMLEHTMRFEALGQDGYRRLAIEPDGSAEGETDATGTFTFDLSDEDVAAIASAIEGAGLTEQPEELRGEEPDPGDETYRFEYGDTRLEAEWQHAPAEVRDLGELLVQVLVDAIRTHEPEA